VSFIFKVKAIIYDIKNLTIKFRGTGQHNKSLKFGLNTMVKNFLIVS